MSAVQANHGAQAMIDRIARDQFAELLRHFAAGNLTNHDYDAAADHIVCDANRKDRSLWAIYSRVWFFYSDVRQHCLREEYKLTDEGRRAVARWILFLYSDLEYEWPIKSFISLSGCLLRLCTLGLAGLVLRPINERRLRRMGPWDLWPFFRKEDLQRARARPRLLRGGH